MELSAPVPVILGQELSAPTRPGLDLSAPASVTAALSQVLQQFCQDQLTFTSWASVSGRLTLATDHAQGHCQLTVNVQEKLVRQDKDVCFLSNSLHESPLFTSVNPESFSSAKTDFFESIGHKDIAQGIDTHNLSLETADIKDVKIKSEPSHFTSFFKDLILKEETPVCNEDHIMNHEAKDKEVRNEASVYIDKAEESQIETVQPNQSSSLLVSRNTHGIKDISKTFQNKKWNEISGNDENFSDGSSFSNMLCTLNERAEQPPHPSSTQSDLVLMKPCLSGKNMSFRDFSI